MNTNTNAKIMPFRLQPVFKNYIWGGTRLIDQWGKIADAPLAESWELAAHSDGDNLIISGELSGMKLSDAAKKFPEIISTDYKPEKNFPLMVKLLDAKNYLSIQAHPDNDYARVHENSYGKTELWYVLEHEPDAFIYMGFNKKITRDEFKEAILTNTLTNYLNKIPVHKGDTFYIAPGTIHALGSGILVAEIQESSNITYRVFDYGRGRELHIDKALDVVKTYPVDYSAPKRSGDVITDCEKFYARVIELNEFSIAPCNKFYFGLCLDGEYKIKCGESYEILKRGENIFIPANSSSCECYGSGKFLLTKSNL